jgi:RNA polymerase sigma-70 factor (ECF subfamily)
MVRKNQVLLAAALLAAAPAPSLLAQGQGAPGAAHRQHGDRQQRRGPRPPPVAALLEHRAELKLTDARVSRLQTIERDLAEKNEPLRRQLEAARPRGAQGERRERPSEEEREAMRAGRARQGSSEAFEALVRRRLKAAYAVALAQLGEPADAEDACQDAFVTALSRIEECRNADQFGAWLMAIVRNRAHDVRRRRGIREALPLDDALGASGGPDPQREARILLPIVLGGTSRRKARQRTSRCRAPSQPDLAITG